MNLTLPEKICALLLLVPSFLLLGIGMFLGLRHSEWLVLILGLCALLAGLGYVMLISKSSSSR